MIIILGILYALYCFGKVSDIEREEIWEEYRQAKSDLRHKQLMRRLERIERKEGGGRLVGARRTVSTGMFGQSVCEEVVVCGLESRELDEDCDDDDGYYDDGYYDDGYEDDDDYYNYDEYY